jgi:hypothetical protein
VSATRRLVDGPSPLAPAPIDNRVRRRSCRSGHRIDNRAKDSAAGHSAARRPQADFGPHPECLRPGGSVLGGSGVIAEEVKEIIDLIVG